MVKKKQFAPHIYPEWGELFEGLTPEQKAEILIGITKFPEYEPKNVPIWKFIKSQLQKDYEIFVEKCNKNGEISRSYWQQKKSNNIVRLPNETERYPKRITNNNKRITINIPNKNDIEEYCKQIGKKIDIKEFIAYYEASDWLDKNGLPINWKQKVLTFARNYKPKEEDKPYVYNPCL